MSQDESQNEIGENLEEKSQNNQNEKLDQSGEEMIEVSDKGINTDELSPEELQKIVENNPELKEEGNLNYEQEVKDEKEMDENELKKN